MQIKIEFKSKRVTGPKKQSGFAMRMIERRRSRRYRTSASGNPIPDTSADSNAVALGGLRVAIGLLFLIFSEYKVFGTQFTLHGGFQWWINRFLEQGAYPFFIPILNQVVLPHAMVIGFLVAYGELAIGVALVLGVLVRAASVFGFIYMMSLMFGSNYPGAHAPVWEYFGASLDHSVLALCFLVFLVGRSDRYFSLQRYIWH